MTAPFLYGESVTENLFVGREGILDDLITNIDVAQNTIIYGSRRVGKSSLVKEAIRRCQKKNKKHVFVFLELSQFSSKKDFIEGLCYQIDLALKKYKPITTKFKAISDFVSTLRLSSKVNSITGEVEHFFDFTGGSKQVAATLNEIFDILENISKKNKLTVIMDEFQSIVDWDSNGKFQWQLRSRIQHQRNIGYVFLGSSRKLIKKIFMESKSAFYRSAATIYVSDLIDEVVFAKWIKRQFKQENINMPGIITKEILELCRSHPYYTQKLCFHIWSEYKRSKKRSALDLEFIDYVITTMVDRDQVFYNERMNFLSSNQRQIVKALARMNQDETIFSKNVIDKFQLPTKPSIQKAINFLENLADPIVYKNEDTKQYYLEDPFFQYWLS